MTSVVQARVFRNSYRDSVELMRIAAELESMEGVVRAGLVMATSANCEVLEQAGLLVDSLDGAGPNDLALAVSATDAAAAAAALELAASRLGGQATETAQAANQTSARSIAEAVAELGAADLALVSTPGPYATAEAMKALKRGLHVFLFSDNVPLADEIELKAMARRKGLLMMGPDCGTAILDGVPLGFANAVRRGSVGLVAASGTGLQQVSCLVDRFGAGISQAIGVGGRDLDERVGGAMMLAGIERLLEDPGTAVLVLISKPPAESVARAVLEVAAGAKKPVVVNFLGGDPQAVRSMGLISAPTFEAAAEAAAAIALGRPVPTAMDLSAFDPEAPDDQALLAAAASAATTLSGGQWRIRGLYSGGSLAGEAKLILKAVLGGTAARHEILDLGDDEYTVGRPHPMIDPRLRNEHIAAAGADPATAVILLDVVLGYGSHDDPAGAMVPAIEDARAAAAADGRSVVVVASVCGTEADPQGLSGQEMRLAAAGALLAPSNARAARLAASIAELAAQASPGTVALARPVGVGEQAPAGMTP
ncbi:MAG TPA: acyl-CoA synthetase FdrA [Candidatus Eisenbacteria bacterium]|nr:acyl-CoA synthetase FdrA [Candidatus Eisenbacteria bacterium]